MAGRLRQVQVTGRVMSSCWAGSLENKLMKKTFLISAALCIILSSCGGQESTPAKLSSVTPRPISTATTTPTQTLEPTFTPTITPLPPYKAKQVIFDYNAAGGLSDFDFFFESDSFRTYSRIILYADGQMIIPGEVYKQKMLSPNEVNLFLSKLDAMGFYSLESNQAHDPTDKLYNFGNNYSKVYDAYLYCVLVNADKSRKLCVYEPGIPYLIPKMKQIINYLDAYDPAEMTPYYPDRILLGVENARNLYYDEITPVPAAPWDEKFPSLETPDRKMMYVDGDFAKEIYLLFSNAYERRIFIQNGKEYTVEFTIILPHEKVTNAAFQ